MLEILALHSFALAANVALNCHSTKFSNNCNMQLGNMERNTQKTVAGGEHLASISISI